MLIIFGDILSSSSVSSAISCAEKPGTGGSLPFFELLKLLGVFVEVKPRVRGMPCGIMVIGCALPSTSISLEFIGFFATSCFFPALSTFSLIYLAQLIKDIEMKLT